MPDDLLLSLKQAEQPKEYLGPPSKKAIVPIKPAVPVFTLKIIFYIDLSHSNLSQAGKSNF